MASLAEIRAKLTAMESKTGSGNKQQSDNAIYPFWNIEEGQTVTLRFLPDSDNTNTFFWVERQMIKLAFPGVIGGANKPVTVQVPCMEMYGETCPVLTEIRPWYKDESLKEMANKYWKKRSYIFQGFVLDNQLPNDTPETPIRRFVIGSQIFNIIKGALMDPDMENLPTDYLNGTDFKLTKTTKGQYADYSTSKWARKESSLNQEQLESIDNYKLHTLNDFLPAKPTAEGIQAIAEMFQASVDGDLYDPARWGQFYKPYGLGDQLTTGSTASTVTPAHTAPVTTTAPVTPTAPAATHTAQNSSVNNTVAEATPAAGKSANDILAMIRSRQQ